MATEKLTKKQEAVLRRLLEDIQARLDAGEVSEDLVTRLEGLGRAFPTAERQTHQDQPAVYHSFVSSAEPTVPVATLRLRLRRDSGNTADATRAVAAVNSLICAAVVAEMIAGEGNSELHARAWNLLNQTAQRYERDDVFYPRFGQLFQLGGRRNFSTSEMWLTAGHEATSLDPRLAAQRSILEWFQRVIAEKDPALYEQLFGFARLLRAQRRSPLLVVCAIMLVGLPATLVYSILKAIQFVRRHDAEAGIREHEEDIRSADAVFSRTRAAIAERVLEDLRTGRISTSDVAVQEVLKQASPAIADLGSRSLIERLTVGISQK